MDYFLFSELAVELNQCCLYPNDISSYGQKWSGDHFHFLSDITKDNVFYYREKGCKNKFGDICYNCDKLIKSKQQDFFVRLGYEIKEEKSSEKVYVTVKEMAILKNQIELLTSKVTNLEKELKKN